MRKGSLRVQIQEKTTPISNSGGGLSPIGNSVNVISVKKKLVLKENRIEIFQKNHVICSISRDDCSILRNNCSICSAWAENTTIITENVLEKLPLNILGQRCNNCRLRGDSQQCPRCACQLKHQFCPRFMIKQHFSEIICLFYNTCSCTILYFQINHTCISEAALLHDKVQKTPGFQCIIQLMQLHAKCWGRKR